MHRTLILTGVIGAMILIGSAMAADEQGAQGAPAEQGSGWTVAVERVQTLFQSQEHTNFPFAALLPNGDIALHHSIGQHVVNERGGSLVSHDRGETWEKPQDGGPVMSVGVTADGTVVGLGVWGGDQDGEGIPQGTLWRSKDGGGTWESRRVPVKMPAGVKPYAHRSLVVMPDGSLLVTFYMRWPDQEKYHSGLLRSADDGDTWEYLADIAYDPDAPGEGYCEPAMVLLGNGDLLCMLRTGGPMFQTRSRDGGRTWDKPHQVMDHGVCPDLCLMSNGVLVCSYGRPNAGIMFSYDGTGEKWEDARDLYTGMGSSYTTVLEIEPGLLLYFYDQSGFCGTPGPGPMNEIRAAWVRVRKAEH